MMYKGVVTRIWVGLMALLTCAWIQAADEKVNLLRSPANLGSWSIEQHEQGAAEGQATSDGIRITVTRPGTEAWHVQVYQGNLDLADGADYTIRFRAKSDAPRQYQCNIGTGVPDYHSVSPVFTFDTTTEWKELLLPVQGHQRRRRRQPRPALRPRPSARHPGTRRHRHRSVRRQAIAFVMPTATSKCPCTGMTPPAAWPPTSPSSTPSRPARTAISSRGTAISSKRTPATASASSA